jgi:hypothetical protein
MWTVVMVLVLVLVAGTGARKLGFLPPLATKVHDRKLRTRTPLARSSKVRRHHRFVLQQHLHQQPQAQAQLPTGAVACKHEGSKNSWPTAGDG